MLSDPRTRPIGRSVSSGVFFPSSSPIPFTRQSLHPVPAADTPSVHLISSDLWEAITGERLHPTNICEIVSHSMPKSDANGESYQAIQFVVMARDRQGSRILQHRLETETPTEIAAIFDAIYPHLNELVSDQSANFVVQKLCEVVTPAQQDRLQLFFSRDAVAIIDHPISCRVLQKFIETASKVNIVAVFDVMRSKMMDLCLSQNGNHIVQKFIELLPEKVDDVIGLIREDVVRLALDNCGCRVVQRLFEKYSVDVLESLVSKVLRSAKDLATNQYGNYVVQNILEAKCPAHISILVQQFRGHFYEFSIHKFASNVIEKCIRGARKSEQIVIFSEVIGEEGAYEDNRIATMVGDQFGNYVIQRIIEYGTESQQNAIYAVVYDHYDRLCGITYASYVISKLNALGFEF
jgi:hypothetical protein